MKALKLSILAIASVVLFSTACKKNNGGNNDIINPEKTAKEFINAVGPQTQSIQINASSATPQVVILSGGTKLTFPAGAFTIDGVPVTGTVTVHAIEVLKRSSVLLEGSNTNHISGAPLASDGFIFVDVKANGQSVDHNLAVPMQVSIPAKRAGITQVWEGVDQNGAPLVAGAAAQMAWAAPRAANGQNGKPIDVSASNSSFTFNFGTTGWINTDVFYSYTNPKTTVYVDLVNNPGTLSSFHSYSGETYVYFCAKGSNVCAQLYTTTGPNGVKSYDNVMPVGIQGKMISFSIKDGHYYYAEQETTLIADQHLTLTLAETTEAAVQASISSLDNY
jgi:hypothetical protein